MSWSIWLDGHVLFISCLVNLSLKVGPSCVGILLPELLDEAVVVLFKSVSPPQSLTCRSFFQPHLFFLTQLFFPTLFFSSTPSVFVTTQTDFPQDEPTSLLLYHTNHIGILKLYQLWSNAPKLFSSLLPLSAHYTTHQLSFRVYP